MNHLIVARDAVLASLVSLRNRYIDLMARQAERLDAIGIGSVPGVGFVNSERSVMADEAAILEEFVELAVDFPVFEAAPGFVVTRVEERTRWFGIRKSHEVLRETECPELPEARFQDARLNHILDMLAGDLSARRVALQHASYTIKRAVVGLNQAAAYSLDADGTRGIERDRHGLETLVSLVDRVILDTVLASRRIEGISAQIAAVSAPCDDQEIPLEPSEHLMLVG